MELSQAYFGRGLFPQLLVQAHLHSVGAITERPLCHLLMCRVTSCTLWGHHRLLGMCGHVINGLSKATYYFILG